MTSTLETEERFQLQTEELILEEIIVVNQRFRRLLDDSNFGFLSLRSSEKHLVLQVHVIDGYLVVYTDRTKRLGSLLDQAEPFTGTILDLYHTGKVGVAVLPRSFVDEAILLDPRLDEPFPLFISCVGKQFNEAEMFFKTSGEATSGERQQVLENADDRKSTRLD